MKNVYIEKNPNAIYRRVRPHRRGVSTCSQVTLVQDVGGQVPAGLRRTENSQLCKAGQPGGSGI
jgi:hypothetical protein